MPSRKGLKGSVFQRATRSGRSWIASYPLPAETDPETGKRRYPKLWEAFYTEDEAWSQLIAWNQQHRTGTLTPPERQTVAEYLAEWLETKRGRLRASTLNRYHYDLAPVIAGIGDVPLNKLDRIVIERWHAWMREQSYSTNQQMRAHGKLSSALQAAVRSHRIPYNVCTEVSTPQHRSEGKRAFTVDELRRFLETAHDPANNHRVTVSPLIWGVMLATGCRGGEVLALTWSDLNLERGELEIRRTITRDEQSGWTIGDDPKTRASRRRVPLPEHLIVKLRAHRAHQNTQRLRMGVHWSDNDLVFPRADGRLIRPHVLWQRFKRILVLARLPDNLTPHSLRHTAATLMIERGVDYNTVKSLLGHESITTTLDRYAHVTTETRRRAIDEIRRALDG